MHYLTSHSKHRIITQCIKSSIDHTTPNVLRRYNSLNTSIKVKKNQQIKKVHLNSPETLCLKEDFQILRSKNKLIIGDENNAFYVNMGYEKTKAAQKGKCKKKLHHYKINLSKIRLNTQTDSKMVALYCTEKNRNFQIKNVRRIEPPKAVYFCSLCQITCQLESELWTHCKTHALICEICLLEIKSLQCWKEHMKVHFKKFYVCYFCQEEFPDEGMLRVHMNVHPEAQQMPTD